MIHYTHSFQVPFGQVEILYLCNRDSDHSGLNQRVTSVVKLILRQIRQSFSLDISREFPDGEGELMSDNSTIDLYAKENIERLFQDYPIKQLTISYLSSESTPLTPMEWLVAERLLYNPLHKATFPK